MSKLFKKNKFVAYNNLVNLYLTLQRQAKIHYVNRNNPFEVLELSWFVISVFSYVDT